VLAVYLFQQETIGNTEECPLGTNFSETSLPQHPRPNKAPASMLESAYLILIAVYMERDGSIAVTNASNISMFRI
jgi:hypothetical protein